MSTNYKKFKKEELIDAILKKDELISELEDKLSTSDIKINDTFERLNESNQNNESLRSVIEDLKSTNENLITKVQTAEKACELHVSDNIQLENKIDKLVKDVRTSNELVENFKQKIDDNATKIAELEESNECYKNDYNEILKSNKYLIACSIVFAIIAIIEAVIITL